LDSNIPTHSCVGYEEQKKRLASTSSANKRPPTIMWKWAVLF